MDEINITEKNIKTSPLFLLIGAAVLILLTYLIINGLTDPVPMAPESDGESSPASTETAPVPRPDDD